jgi:hypothetical protein
VNQATPQRIDILHRPCFFVGVVLVVTVTVATGNHMILVRVYLKNPKALAVW